MYRRIAVPLDGLTESEQALPWAVTLARRAKCPVELVQVVSLPIVPTDLYAAAMMQPGDMEALHRDAERRVRATAEEMITLGVQTEVNVLDGQVPGTLTDHLRSSNADLVVMTTHDRGRLEHLLLGSVAQSVLRHIHTPTLLVRTRGDAPTLAAPVSLSHVLVPLDGSPFGEQIVPHAATIASLLGADITLLTVVQPILATAAMAPPLTAAMAALSPAARVGDDAGEMDSVALEHAANSLKADGLAVRTVALSDGQPARAIVDYTKEHGIDLIAMTTHGRGALKRLIAGSVSDRVIRTSGTAMLMYRPRETAA